MCGCASEPAWSAMLVMVTGILEFLGASRFIGAALARWSLRFDCASCALFPANINAARNRLLV